MTCSISWATVTPKLWFVSSKATLHWMYFVLNDAAHQLWSNFKQCCGNKKKQDSLWLIAEIIWIKAFLLSLIVDVQLTNLTCKICHIIHHFSLFNKVHTAAVCLQSPFLCFTAALLTESHQKQKCLEVFGKALLNCAGRNIHARETQWRDSILWCLSWRTSAEKLLISFAHEWWARNTIFYT